MIARWDRVPRCIDSEIAKAVVLDSRKQRLALTARIMDCRHHSPDTPTEGRRDREGRKTRGPRNGRRRFDEWRETFAAQPLPQCAPDGMPAPQKFDTAPSLTRSPSSYDDDLLYDVELPIRCIALKLKVVSVCPKAKELVTNVASSGGDLVAGRAWTSVCAGSGGRPDGWREGSAIIRREGGSDS
ncbi:hypothetical protein EDD85DRAFT_1028894 [Armillaria nabsnona]|nr:hypothetical protein EDD85DRAFT_1028894 [Armillaria nabsnona]